MSKKVTDRFINSDVIEGYINGLKTETNSTNPNYQVDIKAGACRNDADNGNIVVSSPLTVDITASGANGLDTGSEATNTWYYIWVIAKDDGTTAGLLSVSSSSPTMPSSYTKKRRVGVVRNDAGSNFWAFRVEGNGKVKYVIYDDDIPVMDGGTATTFTDIDCSAAVPPVCRYAYMRVRAERAGCNMGMDLREKGKTPVAYCWDGYDKQELMSIIPLDANQYIQYKMDTSSDSGKVKVCSYWDDL